MSKKFDVVPNMSAKVDLLSTAGRIFVSLEPIADLKLLDFETDLAMIGEFSEGTFQWTGEEGTSTPQKYESGRTFFTTFQQGTEGFSGELPNMAKEVLEFFYKGTEVDSSTYTGDLSGFDILATGKETATLDNMVVVVEFEQATGYTHFAYPNAQITAQKTGEGSSEGTIRTLLTFNANIAEGSQYPADIAGNNILWMKEKTTP